MAVRWLHNDMKMRAKTQNPCGMWTPASENHINNKMPVTMLLWQDQGPLAF